MVNISMDLQKAVHSYLPSEMSSRWDGCISRMKKDRKMKVVNTGLVSSGKSSLFNVLLGTNDENPRFKVGAARTTSIQDVESLNDWIELADTPGIDVNEEDNQTALDSVMEANIIVIIHNIKLGALNSAEYEWIKSIASRMNTDEERMARLIFICNWIDERDSSPDYKSTVDETREMLYDAVGCKVSFHEVSVKRYLAGVSKNKNALINKSNIPAVKEAILNKAKEYSTISEKLLASEITSLCSESRSYLNIERSNINNKISNIKSDINNKYYNLRTRWKSVLSMFRSQYELVKKKRQEMNNI